MTGDPPGPTGVAHERRAFGLPTLVPGLPVFDWLRRLDAAGPLPASLGAEVVALDLSRAALHAPGINALVRELQGRGLRVAGLTGLDPARLGGHLAQLPPVLPDAAPPVAPPASSLAPAPPPAPASPGPGPASAGPARLVVEGNVRSGQQLRCPGGDLTVVGSVASGAEVVAGGSVHVYGALRGRAVAGVAGPGGRVFCRRLEAEVLIIDGVPLTADDTDPRFQGRPVRAWCDGAAVRLEPME